jgi:hypothetical protein
MYIVQLNAAGTTGEDFKTKAKKVNHPRYLARYFYFSFVCFCPVLIATASRSPGARYTGYLASLELTALFPAASALLRRLGISLLDNLRKWPLDIPARHQAMLQPPDKVAHTALCPWRPRVALYEAH